MDGKYQNKYRIASARLKNYDYGQNGSYFVTICTKNRACFFGEVKNGRMCLSEMGNIVKNEWEKTPKIRDYVTLGEWVVMPNHFHAVVIIENYQSNVLQEYQNMFAPQSHNLSAIIRGFKGATTRQMRLSGFSNFAWHPRFYDIIIRNEGSFDRISKYIVNNPGNWGRDKLFLM